MKPLIRWAAHTAGPLLFALLTAAAPARAAAPPAELFYKDADIKTAMLSPSGRRLAIATSQGTPRISLVVFDLAPGGRIVRVAQFPEADVMNVHWVNDDRLIFGVTDYREGSGRPSAAPGLFAVNADGTQLRQLVRRQWAPFVTEGGRDDRRLNWNHRLLSVPAMQPGKVNEEVLLVEYDYGEAGTQTPVWLNVQTGLTRSVDYAEPPHAVHWLTDSFGQPRVVFTRHQGRQAAYWRAPGSTAWTQLYESDLLTTPFTPVAVDDRGALFVTQSRGAQGVKTLLRYDAETRRPADKPLVAAPGFDIEGGLITDDNGRTLGFAFDAEAKTIVWFDDAMRTFQERADTLFPGRVNFIDCRRCGAPDMVALIHSYSDRDPGRLYLFQGRPPEGEKNWRAIKPVREGIRPEQMATVELQRIPARDGLDLPVWITRQPDAKGPKPAVVLVHGGPWVRGVRWGWHADAQFLASRGYVVIEPEMRGSTGYGHSHFEAGFKQWGRAMQDDVADALRWAQRQGIASDKACIAGASYGGYSTLMGLIKDPDLYRCGVAWMAVTDLDLLVSGAWGVVDDISGEARRYTFPELVGDPVEDAAMLAANSPVKQAARIKAPLLLAFGEQDQRVPLAHGKRLREALRAAGQEPIWVTYPGEAHGFGNVGNRVDFAQRMEAFLAKYLAPAQP